MSEKVQKLSDDDVQKFLRGKVGWKFEDRKLQKSFTFQDFQGALDFVNDVGRLAEEENHHPDFFLAWGKVEIKLWTHSAGGITKKDIHLMDLIEEVAGLEE